MMDLTVCMIVRDDARRLACALESVRGIADEVIVVDTGSADASIEVAERYGARVLHHVWDDDFAAARNVAMPHVRGRWFMWLDSDERLQADSRDELRQLLRRTDTLGYAVLRNDFIVPFGDGEPTGKFVTSRILRVLRSDFGFRFTGRCHEQPDPSPEEISAQTGLKVYASTVTLDHDCGYYGEGGVRKHARNGPLLVREIEERPGRLYWMIHAAISLLQTPDGLERGHRLMCECIDRVEATGRSAGTTLGMPFALVLLALEYAAFPPPDLVSRFGPTPMTADRAIELAHRWFPDAATVVWFRARRLYELGQFEEAVPLLRRLLDMGARRSYDVEAPFDPAIVADDARINLGACLLKLAELDESEAVFRSVGADSPRHTEAQTNLRLIADLRTKFGL